MQEHSDGRVADSDDVEDASKVADGRALASVSNSVRAVVAVSPKPQPWVLGPLVLQEAPVASLAAGSSISLSALDDCIVAEVLAEDPEPCPAWKARGRVWGDWWTPAGPLDPPALASPLSLPPSQECISLPLVGAAHAIVSLLKSGHAGLCLAGTQPGLLLCLAPKVLEDPALNPLDASSRPWQSSLLLALRSFGLGPWTAQVPAAEPQEAEAGDGSEVARIYARILPSKTAPEFEGPLPPALRPTLPGYQRRALRWMLQREGAAATAAKEHGAPPCKRPRADDLHPLWARVATADGGSLFVNRCTGRLSTASFPTPSPRQVCPESGWSAVRLGILGDVGDVRLRRSSDAGGPRLNILNTTPPMQVSGGILADEMGLGKTVEVLACILAHPYGGPAPDLEAQRGMR